MEISNAYSDLQIISTTRWHRNKLFAVYFIFPQAHLLSFLIRDSPGAALLSVRASDGEMIITRTHTQRLNKTRSFVHAFCCALREREKKCGEWEKMNHFPLGARRVPLPGRNKTESRVMNTVANCKSFLVTLRTGRRKCEHAMLLTKRKSAASQNFKW